MVAFPIHIRPWMISEHLKKSKPILDLYVSNRNKARLVEGHLNSAGFNDTGQITVAGTRLVEYCSIPAFPE